MSHDGHDRDGLAGCGDCAALGWPSRDDPSRAGPDRNVDGYRPDSAERRAWARKLRGSKIERSSRLGEHIRDCLAPSQRLLCKRLPVNDGMVP